MIFSGGQQKTIFLRRQCMMQVVYEIIMQIIKENLCIAIEK